MKTLTFNSKEAAEIFKDSAKVKGSYEEQENGTVILAYSYDAPCETKSTANNNVEEFQAQIENSVYNAMIQMESYFDRRLDYVHERIDRSFKMQAEHRRGHLPPINSPSQMQGALKSIGIGDDYEVKKGVITVASSDGSMVAYY